MRPIHFLSVFLLAASFAAAARHEFAQAGVAFDLPEDVWRQTTALQKLAVPVTVNAGFTSKHGAVIGIVSSRPLAEMNLNFAEFVQGMKDGFAQPGAKLQKEESVDFAGHKAVRLIGQMSNPKGAVALNVVTYMVGDVAWTVSCAAPADQPAALADALTHVKELAPR